MSIASAIATKQQQVADSYTAVSNKGGTLPTAQNLTNLATAISSIPSGGSGGKYQLLQRISDDNGNEIGTVSGFFTDSNDVEYAVVCLDAQYRKDAFWISSSSAGIVTNLPIYQNQSLWETKETATFNTQKILDFCVKKSTTSPACSHCRSKSFMIDNIVYYGQLPNIVELVDIVRVKTHINSLDISASDYASMILQDEFKGSSNQWGSSNCWIINNKGQVYDYGKTIGNLRVVPVLEIPNN